MGEERFNALILILMYVNNDIEINIEEIIDIFATKHPRRMLLLNPLLCLKSELLFKALHDIYMFVAGMYFMRIQVCEN